MFLYREERQKRTHFIVVDDGGNDRVGKAINSFTVVLSCVPDLQSFRDIPSQTEISNFMLPWCGVLRHLT